MKIITKMLGYIKIISYISSIIIKINKTIKNKDYEILWK